MPHNLSQRHATQLLEILLFVKRHRPTDLPLHLPEIDLQDLEDNLMTAIGPIPTLNGGE